ncbi:MAG: acyl-CoA thioesterase [Nitrospinae bacterium]|nr:acyl-CoA thioesterase [Nitrospinota bacterium]
MPKDQYSYKSEMRVRFGETDLQGVVFNANYLLYVDTAQMDYLRTIGVPYFDMLERGYDIVIVDASLQFLAPARFDEVLEVYARIYEIGNSSIKMDYEIYEAESGRFVARAQTAYVIVGKDSQKPVRVPPYIRRAVREFESREDIEET